MDALFQDIRQAVRSLRRSPAFMAMAVLTLAIGIGSTTLVFRLVDTALLQPLPLCVAASASFEGLTCRGHRCLPPSHRMNRA